VRTGLARFLFTGDAVFQRVSDLSGGERLRAALARGFLGTAKPELLMLDEPTNNLDLANVEFLEGFVREFRAARAHRRVA
jgi:ATPase subunit of ABC transporter with duplicated ATPase domains